MKTFFRELILLFTLSCLCLACGKDEVGSGQSDDTTTDIENVGYLSFIGLNVSVDIESGEEIITKAESEALDSYIVIITNSKDTVVYNGTYGNIKSLEEPLALSPGIYNVDVASIDVIPYAEWSTPHYSGSKEVTIVKNMTTEVTDLVCTLANIKTSVELSADLKELFLEDVDGSSDNLNVVVSLGDNSLTYYREEERCGYFAAVSESNTIKIELSGMYNTAPDGSDPTYERIENWTQTLTNVKAGEWRKIYIRIDNSHDGNVNFEVTVETWVYDEEIDVDIMSSQYTFGEEEVYDPDSEVTEPNSPTVTLLNGHSIDDTFLISSSIFDFDSESCTDIIKGEITPVGDATVSTVEIDFSSDNALLLSDLVSAGYSDLTVGLYPTNSFTDYLTIKQESGSSTVSVTLKYTGMAKLYNYEGTHSVRIMVKDSEGRRSYTNLVIKVEKEATSTEGPSIVWQGGYSFDTRYEVSLSTTLPVVINITSNTGITGFIVSIDSDTLTPETLAEMNLATEMDLINPATDDTDDPDEMGKMETALRALGFPVGDEVDGATSLSFDITDFMPALAVLGSGESDFELKVTDASGTNTQTLKVKVN